MAESLTDPARMNPRARAERALVVARAGYDAATWLDTLRELEKATQLIAQGKLDFGSGPATWDFFRYTVDAIVRKQREESAFRSEIRTLGMRRIERPASLGDVFQLPTAAFQGISPIDIGRIAAVVVHSYAPELSAIIPPALRPKAGEVQVEVTFPEDVMRKIVREELDATRGSSVVEFRPGGGMDLRRVPGIEPSPEFPSEPEEPAPPEPMPTPAEERRAIETPPSLPPPSAPSYPSVEQIRTYGKAELTATFSTWAALFKQNGTRPPNLVYEAARRRFEQVFKFPAPDVLPPLPGLNLQRAFPEAVEAAKQAPLVREYVEERIHVGPDGEHREVVRGMETEPVPAELYQAEATQLLTEKYRPRTLAQVLGNPNVVNRLRIKIRGGSALPASVIFTGPPGTGKTSTARAWAHDYFAYKFAQRSAASLLNEQGFPDGGYVEVNAAKMKDDPTAFLSNRVLPLLRSQGFFGGSIKRFLVFDDVANLSAENQKLLLRPLEQFGKGVTVVWISNDPMKQLPALESRSAGETYKFAPLSSADVEKGLRRIAEGEGWSFPDDRIFGQVAIAAQGDLRAATGLLNARWEEFQAERV